MLASNNNSNSTGATTSTAKATTNAEASGYNHLIIARHVLPEINELVIKPSSSSTAIPEKRIILAIDAGPEAQFALTWTLNHLTELACSKNSGTEICLLNVRPYAVPGYFIEQSGYAPATSLVLDEEYVESVEEYNREKSHGILEAAAEKIVSEGVLCRAIALRGDPKTEILKKIESLKPDLVVVGSRSLGPEAPSFRQSLSDYLSQHASCAVVVAKNS